MFVPPFQIVVILKKNPPNAAVTTVSREWRQSFHVANARLIIKRSRRWTEKHQPQYEPTQGGVWGKVGGGEEKRYAAEGEKKDGKKN